MKERTWLASALLISALASLLAQERITTSDQDQSSIISPPPARAWVARYNGGTNKFDQARAVAVDDSGNVYVTGSSADFNGVADYVTIKYNNTGVKQWVRRYDGPDKLSDEVVAMTIDAAANVYVTGTSVSTQSYLDIVTIKYNRGGARQWVQRYSSPGHTSDVAKAMAVDDSGNVYVTGHGYALGSSDDCITIKYNTTGVKRWAMRYNANGTSYDEPRAIAVDRQGNVFVTGYTIFKDSTFYATIKYNRTGVQQWARGPGITRGEARALAVDDSGNVYVTGTTGQACTCKQNYFTTRYSSAGQQQWQRVYDGPDRLQDLPNAIVVDGAGNVYVTGFSQDSISAAYYTTIKYNRAGVKQWIARYKGPGAGNYAHSLAVDAGGEVYVSGYSSGFYPNPDHYPNSDIAIVKYSGAGVRQWVARYNAPANRDDQPSDLALDALGNIYVTGYSMNASANKDYLTIKYAPSGSSFAFAPGEHEDETTQTIASTLPESFVLAQNFPNPFNPSTTIRFDLPTAGKIKLVIYNLRGKLVHTPVDGEMPAGSHQVAFEANDLASGIYFYRMTAGTYTMTRKMILQK